ncbi:MAG: hypothetical protein JKY24_09310 [Pseudomonadales bacterium]|nr:hypothetical protein [Pseudomonadales bacterium]
MKYRHLNLKSSIQPQWMHDKTPDTNHFYRRTFTARYQTKKKALYYLWVALLLTMIINPFVAYAVGSGMFMTFFSFFVLDEVK